MRNFTFRKRLIAFAVSAFACLGANAFSVQNGILTITDQDNLAKISYNADANTLRCTNIVDGSEVHTDVSMVGVTTLKFSGDFTSGMAQGWLSNDETGKSGITTIDLEDADLSGTPSWSFYKFTNLQEIVWPKAGKITVIPELAFADTGIETVTIPGYIRTIKTHAFRSSSGDGYLKTIIFSEYDADGDGDSDVEMNLEFEAFNNTTAIYDVYIETEGTMTAALDAFPKDITYSQTQPGAPRATLHFPEDKADLYANPQALTPEDIQDDGHFQAWLNQHNNTASQAANGFFQFVSNGSTSKDGDNWGDVILRTFSHAKLDYITPKGLKAFLVTEVKTNSYGQYELTLMKTPVIPAGTGVILYGGPNSKDKNGNPTLAMTVVNYTGPGAFIRGASYSMTNYLMPTSYMDGETEVSGVDIKPYELDATGKKVEWRTFVMNKFSKTDLQAKYKKQYGTTPDDFVGFFRTKKGTISGGKAYLRLKANEFAQADGNEIIVPKFSDYRLEYVEGSTDLAVMDEDAMKAKGYWYKGSGDNITKIDWDEDWGVRNLDASFKAKFSGEPVFELDDEDEDGVVTLIVPGSMINGEEAGDYYNLQGAKVSHPTKGIYVKNGKKVVIK